jgi:hypothetical protein
MKYQRIKTMGAPVFPEMCPICGSTSDLNRREMDREERFLTSTSSTLSTTTNFYTTVKWRWAYWYCRECEQTWQGSRHPKLSRLKDAVLYLILAAVVLAAVYGGYQTHMETYAQTVAALAAGKPEDTNGWGRWTSGTTVGSVVEVAIFSLVFCLPGLGVVALVLKVLELIQRRSFLDRHPGARERFRRNGVPEPNHDRAAVGLLGIEKYLTGASTPAGQYISVYAAAAAVQNNLFIAVWRIRNPDYAEAFRKLNNCVP